jgi:hypothetical protein
MKLKRILLLVAAGCGAMALAWQQQPKKYVILDDKKGGFKVYDVESHELSLDVETGAWSFDATGRPVRGYSKEQGLNFSTNHIQGTAKQTDGGSLKITSGKFLGKVVVDVDKDAAGQSRKNHLEGESVSMIEEEIGMRISMQSAFAFTDHLVTGTVDRTIVYKAPSGTFVLPTLDQPWPPGNPFKSADVKGPITVTLDSARKSVSGLNVYNATIKGDHMTYNGVENVLLLEGHVTWTYTVKPPNGEEGSFTSGEIEWAKVVFNDDGSVKTVLSGSGVATVRSGGGK